LLGEPPTHVIPVTPAGAWYGAAALGLAYGQTAIARRPTPGADTLRYTIVPLPVMPPPDITLEARADALTEVVTGRLESAVDLYRQSVERNGFMTGVLDTIAHGLLGLPLTWQGPEEIVSALSDQDGTPSDYARMHPAAECAKIFRDGIGIGFGLGQYLLMCWRCDGTDWERRDAESPLHIDVQVCRCCGAYRQQRLVGVRELYKLLWRDARWLWRNPITGQWMYTGKSGQIPIQFGAGEWFLFRTVPDQDVWFHGLWTLGTEAAICARDAVYDRQHTSAVCAPTHVFQATSVTAQETRAAVDQEAKEIKFGNKITLPGEWKHEIHAAKAEFVDVAAAIINWAANQWEIAVTGNRLGTDSGTGFANMDVYARATRERRAFYANAWIRQIVAQGLVWYVRDNWGASAVCPVGHYDTRSPEDKLAGAKADEQEGAALKSLHDGYAAVGQELDPVYLQERAQARGTRVRPQVRRAPRELTWDAKTLAAFTTVADARADQGYTALPAGDPRNGQMVAAVMAPPSPGAPVGGPSAPPPRGQARGRRRPRRGRRGRGAARGRDDAARDRGVRARKKEPLPHLRDRASARRRPGRVRCASWLAPRVASDSEGRTDAGGRMSNLAAEVVALVKRFSALLVPGWVVTSETVPPERMPMEGALAVCIPTPTRSVAHVVVVDPWPTGESLAETIAHELTHACLSPLTALLEPSAAAVMLEEQAVENIGKALAQATPGLARAMARAVERYAPRLRARVSAFASGRRARGGRMDPIDLILAAVEAAANSDDPKAALADLLTKVRSIKDGTPPPGEPSPAADEAPPLMDGRGGPPPADGAPAARRPRSETADARRARLAAEEIETIAKDQRVAAKETLVATLRARLPGANGLAAIERRILAAPTYQAAKDIADIAIDMGGGPQRARTIDPATGQPVEIQPTPAPGGTSPHTIEDLVKEGLPRALATEIVEELKTNPPLGQHSLRAARGRLRINQNPWLPGPAADPKAS
jgi:hypothetical protein